MSSRSATTARSSPSKQRIVVARVSEKNAKSSDDKSSKGAKHSNTRSLFQRFSASTAHLVGTPGAFCAAVLLIVLWAASGPVFGFSDTWQLVINTSTTIITFLMVFLIQHTQNHDSEGLRLKLDELIRAIDTARNDFIEIEELDDEQLEAMHAEFERLREQRSQ